MLSYVFIRFNNAKVGNTWQWLHKFIFVSCIMDFFTSYQMKYLLAIQQMIPMIIKCLVLILFFQFRFEACFEKLEKARQACMVDWAHTYVVARRCSAKILFSKFCKFHTKKPVSEFPFNKVRGLQLITLLKTDSNPCVFLWILRNVSNHLRKEHLQGNCI